MNNWVNKIASFVEKQDAYRFVNILFILYFVVGLVVSFFSNGLPDEYLYLYETATIADLIKSGEWIGADLTGTHGFLFKLPVAMLFLMFGKSLFIARAFHVLLACIFIIVLYNFGKKTLKSNFWSFILVFLTITSYQFVRAVPTYLREVPALLSLFLFFNYWLEEKRINIKHGLLLLLLLEAKEYVAVILGISIFIHYLVLFMRRKIEILEFLKNNFVIAFPSFFYIVLMLHTNIIPYNDMLAKSLFIRGRKSVLEKLHFNSTPVPIIREDTDRTENLEVVDMKPNNKIYDQLENKWTGSKSWSYLKKIFGPRTFTLTSIPKIIIIFAIARSLALLKKEKRNKGLLLVFFYSYLAVYIIKTGVERYLLHLSPIVFYYFVLEFMYLEKHRNRSRLIKLITLGTIITLLGFVFDNFVLLPKIIINLTLIITSLLFLKIRREQFCRICFTLGMILYGSLIASVWFYGSYKYGTVHQYFHYGRDNEYNKVSRYIDPNRTYWYNGDINYIYYSLGEKLPPKVYRLKYDFRKVSITKNYDLPIMKFRPNKEFFGTVQEEGIDQFLYLKSTSGNMGFSYQKYVDAYIRKGRLRVVEEVPLQNKTLYVLEYNQK